MTDSGPASSPCPSAEDLAAFCWTRSPECTRAAVLTHLAHCVSCRTKAARMMADAGSDEKAPHPEK